jgi:hypothetical protein
VGEPQLESRRNQCGSTQDQSRSSNESGEVIGLSRTGAKEWGSCGRSRRRVIQEAASDSHADEMKKSWRVTVEGTGVFIDAQSGEEGRHPIKQDAAKFGPQQYLADL